MVVLVWVLLLCGAPCGNRMTSKTTPLLLSGAVIISLLCLGVWVLGSFAFLAGSHGQALICQPLYDHPQYKTLGAVFDLNRSFNETLVIGEVLK